MSYKALVSTVKAPTDFVLELPFSSIEFVDEYNGPGLCNVVTPLKTGGQRTIGTETSSQQGLLIPASTKSLVQFFTAPSINDPNLFVFETGTISVSARLVVPTRSPEFNGVVQNNNGVGAIDSWTLGIEDGKMKAHLTGQVTVGFQTTRVYESADLATVGIAPGDDVFIRWTYSTDSLTNTFSYRKDPADAWAVLTSVVGDIESFTRGNQQLWLGQSNGYTNFTPGADLVLMTVGVNYDGKQVLDFDANDIAMSTAISQSDDLYTDSSGLFHHSLLEGRSLALNNVSVVSVNEAASTLGDISPSLLPVDVAEGTHLLWIDREGELMWGGIIWTVSGNVDGNTMTFSAGGFHSYARRRAISTTRVFTSTDQLTIAKTLIDEMDAVSGSLGIINTIAQTSGVNRDRTYNALESKYYGTVIEQLAAVEDGFDFRYDVAYSNGQPSVTFVTQYPSTGYQTEHVFELGTNIEKLSFVNNGSGLLNKGYLYGGDDGTGNVASAVVEDTSRLTAYPLLERTVSKPDIITDETLTEHGERQLSRGVALTQLTATITSTPDTPIGSYKVGDIVNVRAKFGYLQIDGDYRITRLVTTTNTTVGEFTVVGLTSAEAFETWN